jgi:hypothetical protein
LPSGRDEEPFPARQHQEKNAMIEARFATTSVQFGNCLLNQVKRIAALQFFNRQRKRQTFFMGEAI